MSTQPWTKGGPSPNPKGRGVTKAAKPPGTTGVAAYGGYVTANEGSSELTGSKKWTTYANATNKPIVATGIRYFANLLAGTEWHCDPNPAGGPGAERGVEVVEQGLIKSPMLKPWSQIVRKAAMYRILGFSLHAFSLRRRPDGLAVFAALEHRPQHTIERWLRGSETEPFHTVVQRSKETAKEFEIALDECFYCVDDTLTDSPEGVGLLRHVIEYVRRLDIFEGLEGSACVLDMGGVPIAYVPLSEIKKAAGTEDPDAMQSWIDSNTAAVREFLAKRVKSPESTQWLALDSEPFRNNDGTPGGQPKWRIEILKSTTPELTYLNVPLTRIETQIARVLGIEWALMGATSTGSLAMHEDKTSMFATNLQTTLNELGWAATHQLARRLVARNGLDPDTCTPTLRAEPISTEAVMTAVQALAALQMAGLAPDDPARGVIRSRLRLPPEPDQAGALMLPRGLGEGGELGDEDPTGAEVAPADETPDGPAMGESKRKRKRRTG